MEEKYLNEEKYQKNNSKVKNVGKILLIIGIVTLLASFIILFLGITGFGNTFTTGIESAAIDNINNVQMAKDTFGSFGIIAAGGFLNFIGFGLTIAGGVVMFIAHRREIAAYTTQQVMPVAKEGIDKMAPTFGNAAKEISKGIKEGINEANGTKDSEVLYCQFCGGKIDTESNFCKKCGKKISE